MDSYLNLLSPLDGFNFNHNHFATSSNNQQNPHNGHFNSIHGSPPSQQQVQRTDSELLNLLESGQKLDDFSSYSLWDPSAYKPNPGTPWKPALSRSYSDSPHSTSSALSSSAPSSNTCSPWETLPALAPSSSPDYIVPESLGGNQQYPGLLDFPSLDDHSANAFHNLSLGSPALMPQHQLPDMLDMDAYNLGPPHHQLSHKSSSMSMASVASYHMLQHGDIPPVPPLPNEYNPHADMTITPTGMPQMRATSPSASDPGDASHRPHERFLFTSPSMPALNNRARYNRRKASRVAIHAFDGANMSDDDYGNDDDADEDFEYDEEHEHEDGLHPYRSAKRARHSSTGDGEEGLNDGTGLPRRPGTVGRKPSGFRRATTGDEAKARKNKNKKRHQCSRPGCSSSFTRITDMERHLASVHRPVDDNTNRCTFCRKQFSREDAVLRHENDSCPMRPKKKAVEKWI